MAGIRGTTKPPKPPTLTLRSDKGIKVTVTALHVFKKPVEKLNLVVMKVMKQIQLELLARKTTTSDTKKYTGWDLQQFTPVNSRRQQDKLSKMKQKK